MEKAFTLWEEDMDRKQCLNSQQPVAAGSTEPILKTSFSKGSPETGATKLPATNGYADSGTGLD